MSKLESRICRLEQRRRAKSVIVELRERHRQTRKRLERIREDCTRRDFVQGEKESLHEVWARSMGVTPAELKKELQARARRCGRRGGYGWY